MSLWPQTWSWYFTVCGPVLKPYICKHWPLIAQTLLLLWYEVNLFVSTLAFVKFDAKEAHEEKSCLTLVQSNNHLFIFLVCVAFCLFVCVFWGVFPPLMACKKGKCWTHRRTDKMQLELKWEMYSCPTRKQLTANTKNSEDLMNSGQEIYAAGGNCTPVRNRGCCLHMDGSFSMNMHAAAVASALHFNSHLYQWMKESIHCTHTQHTVDISFSGNWPIVSVSPSPPGPQTLLLCGHWPWPLNDPSELLLCPPRDLLPSKCSHPLHNAWVQSLWTTKQYPFHTDVSLRAGDLQPVSRTCNGCST